MMSGPGVVSASVEQAPDLDRRLLCLGDGQQWAVGQGVQEPSLSDPALLIDEGALHHRDLACWPTERL
jgi:hypothetical protein